VTSSSPETVSPLPKASSALSKVSSLLPETASPLIATQPAATTLHIASVMAQTRPDAMAAIKAWLATLPGVEIHAENAQGKLVLVVETENERNILKLLDEFAAQPGAISAALVYHEILTGE
jgi:nitrate reductase NapD